MSTQPRHARDVCDFSVKQAFPGGRAPVLEAEIPLAPHRNHVLGAEMDDGAGSRKIPSGVHWFSWIRLVRHPVCCRYSGGNFNSSHPQKRTKGTSDPTFFNFRIGSTELLVFPELVPTPARPPCPHNDDCPTQRGVPIHPGAHPRFSRAVFRFHPTHTAPIIATTAPHSPSSLSAFNCRPLLPHDHQKGKPRPESPDRGSNQNSIDLLTSAYSASNSAMRAASTASEKMPSQSSSRTNTNPQTAARYTTANKE
jgi:hypothetical protein